MSGARRTKWGTGATSLGRTTGGTISVVPSAAARKSRACQRYSDETERGRGRNPEVRRFSSVKVAGTTATEHHTNAAQSIIRRGTGSVPLPKSLGPKHITSTSTAKCRCELREFAGGDFGATKGRPHRSHSRTRLNRGAARSPKNH